MFHADGKTDRQTGMTKLTVTFRKFANAPKRNVVTWAVLYAVNEESPNSLRYRIQLGFYHKIFLQMQSLLGAFVKRLLT